MKKNCTLYCGLMLAVFFSFISLNTTAQTPLVYLENNKLVYTPYANQGQTESVNRVPDFSHAGYRGGGVKLPDLAVAETLNCCTR